MIGTWPRRSQTAPPPVEYTPLPRLPAPELAPEWSVIQPAQIHQPSERNCCGVDVAVFGHTLCPLAPPPPAQWRDRRPRP